MYSRPRCTVDPVGLHVLWAHLYRGPTSVLDHNIFHALWLRCIVAVHVGLLYMWAYNTCGPTVHVGLLYMW